MPNPHPDSAYKLKLWLIALTPFGLLVAWLWSAGSGYAFDDPGMYLMHAQALLEGRPYTDIAYIASPRVFAPAVQPPGLPVFLAAVMGLFGVHNEVAIKLLMISLALPFLVLPGLVFAKHHGMAIGVCVTAFLGVSQAWLSMRVLSDLGFASAIWGLIYILDQTEKFKWRHVAAVFVLGTVAMSYRFLGAALVPTVWLFALANWRRLGFKPFVPAILWTAGGLGVLAITNSWRAIGFFLGIGDEGFLSYLLRQFYTSYLLPLGESHLNPFPASDWDDAYHVVSLTIALVALIVWARRHWREASFLFGVAYVGTLLTTWSQSARYLVPVLPIVVFGLFLGVSWGLPRLLKNWSTRRISESMMMGAAVVTILASITWLREPRPVNLVGLPDTQEVYAYLLEQSGTEDVRVMAGKPRTLSWETGIPAMEFVLGQTNLTLEEIDLRGITYVLINHTGSESLMGAAALKNIQEQPCRLEVVLQNDAYDLYRVLPACNGENGIG